MNNNTDELYLKQITVVLQEFKKTKTTQKHYWKPRSTPISTFLKP